MSLWTGNWFANWFGPLWFGGSAISAEVPRLIANTTGTTETTSGDPRATLAGDELFVTNGEVTSPTGQPYEWRYQLIIGVSDSENGTFTVGAGGLEVGDGLGTADTPATAGELVVVRAADGFDGTESGLALSATNTAGALTVTTGEAGL